MLDILKTKERIRERREALGYPRSYVAEKMDVTIMSVVKWEDQWTFRDALPTIDHLMELCELLDTDPNYILLGKE